METEGTRPRIRVLPPFLANQIAAGEVIQRPESVVKELIENAIDAGADHITVIVVGAGKTSIMVRDNGCGIPHDEAPLAFERHATSKITRPEDLEAITSLGFRGEALPSIAAVAQVELITRTAESELATLVRVAGGTLEEHTMERGDRGTSVTVRNLFYNTPARRQFLKADATELRHIVETVQRYIFSNPDIHLTLIADGNTIYDVEPAPLLRRIAAVMGERTAASLVEVREETDVLTITGYVGRPSAARKTRGEQFLFVNGRYVVNRLVNHAIVSSYENMITAGEFPPYVLFLHVDPREVDVNVHPSKLEVKFGSERNIYPLVQAVVRRALAESNASPRIGFRDAAARGDAAERLFDMDERGTHGRTGDAGRGFHAADRPAGRRMGPEEVDTLFRSIGIEPGQPGPTDDGMILLPSEQPVSDTRFLWQLHNKYIFTPIKSGLMIIDQHVAHERILYEKALAALEHAAPFSQQLLFPHVVLLPRGDFILLERLAEEFRRLGFVVRLTPPETVLVEAVPQDVRVGAEESILEELLEQFKEYEAAGVTDTRHAIAASYACRAAIKAGDKLSPPEMQILIDKLFATSNPFVCPHGRPVLIRLPLEELDRRFGRIP